MKVTTHNRFQQPIQLEVTSLLVTNDVGDPIMAAVEYQPGHVQAAHAKDSDFETLLNLMGVRKTSVVCEPPPIKPLA